jgi:hypothetical protein
MLSGLLTNRLCQNRHRLHRSFWMIHTSELGNSATHGLTEKIRRPPTRLASRHTTVGDGHQYRISTLRKSPGHMFVCRDLEVANQ